jgi:hypothetical protein
LSVDWYEVSQNSAFIQYLEHETFAQHSNGYFFPPQMQSSTSSIGLHRGRKYYLHVGCIMSIGACWSWSQSALGTALPFNIECFRAIYQSNVRIASEAGKSMFLFTCA